MKKLLLFLKNSILLFILLAISYQVKAQDTTPPVFAMPENTSFDCVQNGQTRVLNYGIGAGDEFDDTILQATQGGAISGGAFAQGGGVTFDITPTNSIVITSFDVFLYTNGVATSFNVDVFYKRGTRVGFENNAAAWTLAGTATIPFGGATAFRNVDFGTLGLLAGETYSIWIRGYSAEPAMIPVGDTGNIGDANFTTSNHHAVAGAFQGTNISGGPYNFRGNINYVLAPFSNVTQTAGLPSGSAFPIGVTTNTFTATDVAGNVATKSFTVTVNEDTELPTLTAKTDYTRNTDTGNCTFTNLIGATNIPNGIAADNCSIASYSYVLTGATTGTVTDLTNQVFNIGVTTITWTATDTNGNISLSDDFTVTVSDTNTPIISCPAPITDTHETWTCGKKITYPFPTSSDACAYTAAIPNFTYLGNQNGKSYYISDATADFATANAASFAAGGYLTQINDATENAFVQSLIPADVYIGYNDIDNEGTFTWSNGQTSAYSNWGGGEPNDFNGNEDATVMFTNGSWNDVNAANSYRYLLEISGGIVTQTAGLSTGSIFPVGTTTNTFSISDEAGNSSSCSFDVTITDTQAPVIAIAKDTVFNCILNGQSVNLNYDVGAIDNCNAIPLQATNPLGGGNVVIYTSNPTGGGATFDITATNSMVITSFDVYAWTAGNVAAPYTVEVYYKTGSKVGFETDAAAWTLANTVNFQSDGRWWIPSNIELDGIAIPAGETYAIWIRGYSSTVNACVGFDNDAAIIGDANFTTSNNATAFGNFQGSANNNQFVGNINYTLAPFTNVTQTAGLPSGSAFPIGITTNTFTATDASGNSTTKSFTVTVNEDTELPTLTAKTDYTRNADTGNCTFTNTDIPNGIAADNCSVASYSYILTGATTGTVATLVNQAFNVGITTVTWTATDTNGNVSLSDDFTVTVNDTQLPTLTAQTDYTRNTNNGNCSFTNTDIPNGIAADNCSVASYSYILTGATTGTVTTLVNQVFNLGITTITWTATDANGNISATDDFTVTVSDTQNPTITCPTNIIVNNDPNVCGAVVNFALPTVSDNCTIASLNQTAGIASGDLYPVGTTTNTFVVTDNSGNTATCSFDVTVNQRYELLYSAAGFSEIYPTTSGVLGNTISIRSYACDIFTGTNGENFVTTGKVNVSNIPAGLTASIIKVSDTELAFRLEGSAINNAVVDEIENLTVIFNDAAFVGVTAANVITSTKTDLVIRYLDLIPLNLQATAISTSQINLTWETNPIHRAYRLYRNGRLVREFSTTTTRFEDTNLNADTYYSYKLVGVINQNIESDASRANEWTFPEKPILLSISTICGEGKANLKIEGSGTIFRVYAQETNGNLLLESSNGSFELPSISETTTFYASVIGRGGKESEKTPILVNIQPIFEAKILGENTQTNCENSIELTAQEVENATYTWFLNGTNLGTNGQTITANYSGNYQVFIQKGVCNFMSEKVKVKLNQNPVAQIQQSNGTKFCQNGTINAVSTGENINYEWILNNVIVGNNQSLNVTQSGTYTLQITNATGCQASSEIEIIVTNIPQTPILEATQNTICPNTETIISIQNPQNEVTYQWFRNGRNLNQTGNSISTSIKGSYQVRAISNQNNLCNSVSNELEINHFEALPIYLRISEDKKSLFVEDANLSQSEITNIEWYFEGELSTNLGSTFEISPTENGNYSAKITNQNGCLIQTRTVYFRVPQTPVITGEEDLKNDLFKIYPNPSSGIFKVQFPVALTENIEVIIFDGIGRKIYTTTFEKGSQEFKISLQNKPSGMYMIRFNQNGATYSKSVIIE